ncbi:MAG: SH3 domain-containing protein [Anaerolineales bacterium]|nr:SH3 domain-containing protein [Anaerolineales bacterium]
MNKLTWQFFLFVILLGAVTACNQAGPDSTPATTIQSEVVTGHAPTASATPVVEPEVTATSQPAFTPTSVAAPQGQLALATYELRAGPGRAYELVDQIANNSTTLIIVSRTEDSGWYEVRVGSLQGWLPAEALASISHRELIPVNTELPPTPTVAPTPTELPPLEMAWLVTLEDVNGLSDTIGITDWTVEGDVQLNFRVCRAFLGVSTSFSSHSMVNCIFDGRRGDATLAQRIVWLQQNELLSYDAILIDSPYAAERNFLIYADTLSDRHIVFDAYQLHEGLMYWTSIDLKGELFQTPEQLFALEGPRIETLLYEMLLINFDRIQPNAPTPLPAEASRATPAPTPAIASDLHLDWVIPADELDVLTEPLGMGGWQLESEILWADRACRQFFGYSWSVSPNSAINCVFQASDEVSSLAEAVALLRTMGVIGPDAVALDSEFAAENAFALYADRALNGHTVFDGVFYHEGQIVWVSISLGTGSGMVPTDFLDDDHLIETFLHSVYLFNLDQVDF